MDKVTIVMSADCQNACARLPVQVRKKVGDFFEKFRVNPNQPGINLERIDRGKAAEDGSEISSVRIDYQYRGIVAAQGNTYVLLWVDNHDEAYAWARNKRLSVNPRTGVVQVFSVPDTAAQAEPPKPEERRLFDGVPDSGLLELGVPQALLGFVRWIQDAADFDRKSGALPRDVIEYLSFLKDGESLETVLDLAKSVRDAAPVSDSLPEALRRPESRCAFVVIDSEQELRDILEAPLEKWRVFLHPTQRKIAYQHYSGSARVLGTAGTGKTVVAMHRAKFLASQCGDGGKILFTTFTKNLVQDIDDNLRKICSGEEMSRIEVTNLDAWVTAFLKKTGTTARILYGDDVETMWQEAINFSGVDLNFDAGFYRDEWSRVIIEQKASERELYLNVARTGRGRRLGVSEREQVWKVVEFYRKLMKERNVMDSDTAKCWCASKLKEFPGERYKHVIVDEGQDFSLNAYRLIRALAGPEHSDDIFVAGDPHQRIYGSKACLSRCGIYIRGRSGVLRLNYRTTDEIRRSSFAVLKDLPFDDLDEGADPGGACVSLMHGEKPKFQAFKRDSDEADYLAGEIRALQEHRTSLKDICVVARTQKQVDGYRKKFKQRGFSTYEIKRTKTDSRDADGLRVATMHRVKGLEFQHVFVAGVNAGVVPPKAPAEAGGEAAEQERLTAERCLLYVAMSRARRSVTVTSYGRQSPFFKELKSSKQ